MADLLPYALTTLSDVKETLGIPSSNTTQDNLIRRKINQATQMIENYTGRRFKLTTYANEEYDATNTDQLVLKQRPVVIDDNNTFLFGRRNSRYNDNDWETVEADRQFLDVNAAVLDLSFVARGSWNKYRVSYSAGYSEIPSDIAEAAATLAAYLVSTGIDGSNIKRKEEGQRKVEYYDVSSGGSNGASLFQLAGIADVLASYSNMPLNADK